MNKLVRGNLVRGLPSKIFENDHQKGKQHKASLGLVGFFFATKDETSGILKTFITGIENEINHKVKIIRCDNGTEFKNNDMNQFCRMKGIKREFSVAKTSKQNRVAKRKNRTLIEAARTMLADSLLPNTFWAEAVSIACYVQNKVLVTKPHNKTPYELLHGRPPSISFMRPFGCLVTILNTLDTLGKFDEKADEGFFAGYSINSKDFRVFNTRTRKVEENLHINFLKNKPNVTGSGLEWLFDIDLLTNSMNYEPVTTGNQTNKNACIKDNVDVVPTQQYILLPLLYGSPQSLKDAVADDAGKKTNEEPVNEVKRNGQEKEGGASNKENDQNVQDFRAELDNLLVQQKEGYANITNRDSTDTSIFSGAYDDEDVGVEADLNNLDTTMNVSPIPTTRIHKDHPKDHIICDINSATQTRRMTKISEEHAMTLVDLPKGKRAIGTKWVYRNKKDERGIVVRNKARLVAQGYNQEEGIDYDEVYVDDIIFGSTKKSFCVDFEQMMHKRFQMSSIGELTCFLGLQVMQKDDGIFISQDKYMADILKKFDFVNVKTASTPIETNKALLKDEESEDVDVHLYRSMIRSLMYLTASRPDIMFAVCACARFQVTPKVSHLHVVKRIFRYLKGQPKLGLWYPMDSSFDLEAFSDSDYTGARLDRKSTTGGCQFLGKRLISWQCKKKTIVANCTTEAEGTLLWKLVFGKLFYHGEQVVCKFNGKITIVTLVRELCPRGKDESVYKEWEDRMERVATTAFSLEAEELIQLVVLGAKIPYWEVQKLKLGLRLHLNKSNDPPLLRVNTLRSGEDSMKLKELMELCTKLSERILDNKNKKSDLIQALVDKKKVIISETSIWSDLKLDDAEGTNCLPTATIFNELERMRYENFTQKLTFYKAYFSSQWKFLIHTILQCLSAKITSWNEFSSTMASAIMCLATNQKFNLSKYIFDNMVKNLDGWVKFLMYPRFVQVFLDKQVKGMSKHKGVYVTPSHTKKVFANMKRPCKDFFGSVTSLFSTMMVQATEDMGADLATPTDSHSTPIITQPSSSKPQNKKSRRKQRKDSALTEPTTKETTSEERVSTPSYDLPPSGEDRMQLAELMSFCTNLQEKVLDLEKAKTAQVKEITSLKKRVKQLEKRRKLRTSGLRRRMHPNMGGKLKILNETQETNDDNLMFDIGVLEEKEIKFEKMVEEHVVSVGTTTKSIPVSAAEVVTTASASIEEHVPASTKIFSSSQSQLPQLKDKGKGKMVEPELQAELIEEEMLARQKEEEANIALIESWDNTQAMMELMNRRKKHFAKLRAKEIRRKPPTKFQKRNQMSTYLKNIAGYKHIMKGSKTRTEESSKRAGDELESDMSKKQKIDEHVEVKKDD
ncbi:putative ribonuclease H-like domain-containing protein [Tanacetum coccineum]